jgi:DNA-binding CsgD family transcriptional regulator
VMSRQADWVFRGGAHASTGIKAMREIDALLERSAAPGPRAIVKFRLANFLAWGTGELEEAERACTEALELFQEIGDVSRALLAANELASIEGFKGELPAMEVRARGVLAKAEAAGERFAAMQAAGALGWSTFHQGRFADSEAALNQSIEIARQLGNPHRLTSVLSLLAVCLGLQGRTDEALEVLGEAKAADPSYAENILLGLEANVHWLAGNYPAALENARSSAIFRREVSRRRAVCLPFAAICAAEADRIAEAHALLEKARSVYGDRDWLIFRQYTLHAGAVLGYRAGRRTESLSVSRAAAARILAMGALPFAAFVLVDLIEMMADARQPQEEIDKQARQLGQIADRLAHDLYAGLAAIGCAWSRLAAGMPEQAAGFGREAASLLGGTGCRAHLGRAWDVLGRARSGTDPAEALEALGRAAATFETCGAVWRRAEALAAMRRMGSPGRRAAAAVLGPSSLTPREREIVRLVSEGATAREIAQRLVISVRTVETHLSRAYAKLGVQSRFELVRRLPELEP